MIAASSIKSTVFSCHDYYNINNHERKFARYTCDEIIVEDYWRNHGNKKKFLIYIYYVKFAFALQKNKIK